MKRQFKPTALSALALIAALLGCFASLALYFGSVPSILRPFIEGRDPLVLAALIKAISTQHWLPGELVQTPQLAAPFGFQLGDYPMGDLLQFFLLRLLNGVLNNPYTTYSVYYLTSFVTVAVSFFVCARKLGTSRLLAIPLTIAFTILPFHFSRYEHVLFAQYVFVAPLALIAFYMALGLSPVARRSLWSTFAVIAVASYCGIYYAFFFCFFLALALLINIKTPRKKARIKAFALIVGTMMVLGASNYVSNFIFTAANGKTALSDRHVYDSEMGGLRLSTFMLPTHQTLFEPLRAKVQTYLDILPQTEGKNEYGGALAVLFLFITMSCVIIRRSRRSLRQLGLLNLGALLFASVGGLNIVFALFVTPSFRSQNRISVFIACFALFAAALVLKRVTRRWSLGLQTLFAAALSAFIIFDQTPVQATGFTPQPQADFESETTFFKKIEASCAANSEILQLPHTGFPETPPVGRMLPYEQFKPYIATDHLRWSFGTVREREPNVTAYQLSQLPLNFDGVRKFGFSGVEIDTAGYPDNAPAALESLKKTLGPSLFMSENGRYFFFAIPGGDCFKH